MFGFPWVLPNSSQWVFLSRLDKYWTSVLWREFSHQKEEGTKLSDLSASVLKSLGRSRKHAAGVQEVILVT